MKRIIIFLICFCTFNAAKAQTIYDITTGYDQIAPGLIAAPGVDDDWKLVQIPGPSYPNVFAPVTNGSLWNSVTNTIDYTSWGTPPTCGRHLCPHVTSGGSGWYHETTSSQPYIYELTFTAPCCVINPRFSISNIFADNTIGFVLNGHPYSAVAGIVNINPAHLNLCGTNSLKAIIVNTGNATGFYICGKIIQGAPAITPVITGNTSFCEGDSLVFSGASSTGTIQNHFWEIAECTSSGAYVSPPVYWNNWFVGSPGAINFSNINLGFTPQCGKYYKIKLVGNNACDTTWTEANKIIYIKCKPTIYVQDPAPVCEGSTVTLSVSGNATSYYWAPPINLTANSVSVIANTNTSYLVTGTLNGCTSTSYAHTIVAPANLDVDISTGVNPSGNLFAFAANDDTWKVRGVPGTIYTSPHTSLADAKVVAPYWLDNTFHWTSTMSAEWISTVCSATGSPQIVAVSEFNDLPTDHYWFETNFELPISTYTNLRIEANQYAVDNGIRIYLNSQALSGNGTNMEFSHFTGSNPATFNTLHNAGIIATNSSHYVEGTNVVLAQIGNFENYMGFLLYAHVKGECTPTHSRMTIISDDAMEKERVEATTFIFPNPSAGNFTISSSVENIQNILVKDVLGRIVKEIKNISANKTEIDLNNETNGIYFIQISCDTGTITKRIIKQ